MAISERRPLSHLEARINFAVVDVYVQLVYTILSADKPEQTLFSMEPAMLYPFAVTYKMRPSSLQEMPAVLSGDGGTSNTPWSGGNVPRMALSSHRFTT